MGNKIAGDPWVPLSIPTDQVLGTAQFQRQWGPGIGRSQLQGATRRAEPPGPLRSQLPCPSLEGLGLLEFGDSKRGRIRDPPWSISAQQAVHFVLSHRVRAKHSSHSGSRESHPRGVSRAGKPLTAQPHPSTHRRSLFTLGSEGHPGKAASLQPAGRGGSQRLEAEALGYRGL